MSTGHQRKMTKVTSKSAARSGGTRGSDPDETSKAEVAERATLTDQPTADTAPFNTHVT